MTDDSETGKLLKAAYAQLRKQGMSPEDAQALLQNQLEKAIPQATALIMSDPRIQALINREPKQ